MPYVRRYGWVLGAAVFGLLITRFLDAIIPQFMRTAIDSLADANLEPNLALPALGIIGAVAIRFLIYIVARRALRRISVAVAYDLRKRIFNHVQYQGPNFFNRYSTGDLMSRAVNDVGMINRVLSFGWVMFVLFFFTLSTGLYFMFMMSPELASWVILPLPLIAIVGYVMARGMFPYFRERQEALADVTSFTQENLNGIRTIQAMGQEGNEIKRFTRVSTRFAHAVYRATRYQAVMNIAMGLLTSIAPVIVLGYGGSLVLQGQMTVGTMTAFFAYLMMVTGSVTAVGWGLSMFTAAAAGTQRVFEIIDTPREVSDEGAVEMPVPVEGRIEFRHFTYRHPDAARPAVDDVNVSIAGGETIAILGRVGSGKSTFLKSIVRLIDTPANSVFIDGCDVCELPIEKLREVVALVPQDPFLFSATLRENLTYDDPSRADDEIWEAARAAGLADAIGDLFDGLDTVVGERGITLSGGQKQRATLTRGLIRDTKVLLLDDCFSSVDTETEERILSGLKRMRGGQTTILISHRVSTARHADRILVLENGRVVESGSHAELLALGGYYADLEAVQSNQDEDSERKARLLRNLEEGVAASVGSAAYGDRSA
jgi:ATP-binding cassette subfamily B protein